MIIRLRWKQGSDGTPNAVQNVVEIPRRHDPREKQESAAAPERELVTSEEMARGVSALLWPASTVPMALALWRMGQDLGYARDFFLQAGLASKWQVWFALSLSIMAAARHLAKWRASQPKAAASTRPAAFEVVTQPSLTEPVLAEQTDAHSRRRFGNLR
jgi:hypothetical protein